MKKELELKTLYQTFSHTTNYKLQITKGKVACPVCHAETCSKYLNHSKKLVYMGYRRFLAPDHRYRKKASWFDGNEENRRKPKIVTGEEVFLEVKDLVNDRGKNGNKRKKRNTIQMWKKKSIFFYLPYWKVRYVK